MRAKFFWVALLLVAVLGIAAAASASTRGLAAGKRVAPHTVSSVAGQSLGLAANSGTLVWVVARPSSASCRLSVVAIDVASGAGRQLAGATGPTCSARDLREADVRAAVGGGTALWSLGEGTTIDRQRVLSAPLRGGIVETVVGAMTHRVGSGGDYLTGLAASGSTMVYGQVTVAAVDPGCQTTAEHCLFAPTGGEVRAVSGGKSHLLSAVPAVLVAASPTLVALVEPDTSASEDPRPHTAPGGTVQVRTAATGSLITSFAPSGTVKAIAFSQGDVVVLERARDQTDRLQVWSSSSGTRLGERRVSAQSAPLLATGGSWVMRGVGDTVFGLDRDSNIGIELAQVARAPVALALVGQRIEAAINLDGSTRLEATTMQGTAGLVPVTASYHDAYQGWPIAPVDSPHGIYSGFLNPGCKCPSRYARTTVGSTQAIPYNAGLDVPVNDASPDPAAPPGTTHAIYAVEGGTVWLNSPGVHGCGGSRIRIGHFGYGHTVSELHVGQHVDAGQRIGWSCKGSWHVHLSEFLYPRDSPFINPLRPGGRITPVTDTSPPYIDQFRFYTKKGTRLSRTSLHGVVVPVALTQDRFPYKDWPTAPVSQHVVYALALTVHQGQTLVYSRELFRLQMAPEPLTTLFYMPLVRRNVEIADCASRRADCASRRLPRCDPEYWMRLWRQGWDTRKLPAGLYRITLHVSDEAGNTATRSITVRIVH